MQTLDKEAQNCLFETLGIEHICNRLNFDFNKILLISAENLMQPKTSERDSTAFRLLGYRLPWPHHAQVSYSIQYSHIFFH